MRVNKYFFLLLPVLSALGGLWQTSLAEGDYSGNNSGFYVDLGAGTVVSQSNFLGNNISQTGGFAGVAQAGWQFNRYIAAETGIQYFHVNGKSGSILPIDLKGMLPLGAEKRFKLFAKLGAGVLIDAAGSGTLPFLGVGASYGVTSNLDVGGGWQGVVFPNLFGSGVGDISTITANIIYHF